MALAILGAVLALAFLFAGGAKFLGTTAMLERAAHVKFSFRSYRVIGLLEVAGSIGVIAGIWIPILGALAAAGLVLLMIGATIAHGRVGDGFKDMLVAIVLGVLALAYLVLAVGRL